MAVPCFTISINGKSYLWETESARQQDDFLITVVRSYRQYQNGEQPRLIGFQVGEIPGAPPAYEIPVQSGGMATPSAARFGTSLPTPGPPRPGTAHSVLSNGSSRYEGVPPHVMPQASSSTAPPPPTFAELVQQQQGSSGNRAARLPSTGSAMDMSKDRGNSPPNFATPFQDQQQPPRGPSPAGQSVRRQGSIGNLAGQLPPTSSRPPLPIPQATPPQSQPIPPSTSSSGGLAPDRKAGTSQRSATPTRPHIVPPDQPFIRRGSQPANLRSADPRTPNTATTIDESTAAAKAAALLGQDNNLEDDSDVMLTNVEEMLEGLEWGAVAHGHSADELEKRLMGELNALEAAGIHAIIESDDRVNDVIRYLDNALADLDKMDLMISLYKTHLNVSLGRSFVNLKSEADKYFVLRLCPTTSIISNLRIRGCNCSPVIKELCWQSWTVDWAIIHESRLNSITSFQCERHILS